MMADTKQKRRCLQGGVQCAGVGGSLWGSVGDIYQAAGDDGDTNSVVIKRLVQINFINNRCCRVESSFTDGFKT
jgi:hypothetical protein